jgi:hypothetical protein
MIVIVVGALLAAWLVLSAVAQFPGRLVTALQTHDPFRLLPKWTFFAPNPGCTDYHLVYRDFTGETPGQWREVPVIPRRDRWMWLWNPRKRFSKAVTDCTQSLLEIAREGETAIELLPFALPYIAVLNVVCALPAADGIDGRQFAVVETEGYVADGPPRLLVASAVHPLRSRR